jgi:predicted CoA-binding protein
MTTPTTDPLLIDLAAHPGVVAVVGLSPKLERASNGVARYLIDQGVTVYPVNPIYADQEILGRKVYRSLTDIPEHIHIVDIFRRSEFIPAVVEEAIAAKADAIWLQLGITHPEAEARARAAGLGIVEDRCLKVEHMRIKQRG